MTRVNRIIVVLVATILSIAAHADLTITQQIQKEGPPQDANLPGFPIRTVVDTTGMGKTTVTVMAVSENPLADSEFAVPDGYRRCEPRACKQIESLSEPAFGARFVSQVAGSSVSANFLRDETARIRTGALPCPGGRGVGPGRGASTACGSLSGHSPRKPSATDRLRALVEDPCRRRRNGSSSRRMPGGSVRKSCVIRAGPPARRAGGRGETRSSRSRGFWKRGGGGDARGNA